MKKFLSLLLVCLMALPFGMLAGIEISAAGNTVYLSDAGDDANSGTEAAAPLKTLTQAYNKLGAQGGTIVIAGTFTQTANFTAPAHAGKVTIKGLDASSLYTNSSKGVRFFLGGETEFTNIKIDNLGDLWMVVCSFNNFTMTDSVTMTRAKSTFLVAGVQDKGGAQYEVKDVTLNLEGGLWSEVIGVLRSGADGQTGDTLKDLDVTINVDKNVEIAKIAAFSRSFGTSNVLAANASCTINLKGGKITHWICMSDSKAPAKNGYEKGVLINIAKDFKLDDCFKGDEASQVNGYYTDANGNKIFYGISGDCVFEGTPAVAIGASKVSVADELYAAASQSIRFRGLVLENAKTGEKIDLVDREQGGEEGADTTAVPETTEKAPETTKTPETTKKPTATTKAPETTKAPAESTGTAADTAEGGSNMVVIIIVIAAVVVAGGVVAFIIIKKKKAE